MSQSAKNPFPARLGLSREGTDLWKRVGKTLQLFSGNQDEGVFFGEKAKSVISACSVGDLRWGLVMCCKVSTGNIGCSCGLRLLEFRVGEWDLQEILGGAGQTVWDLLSSQENWGVLWIQAPGV